MFIENVSERGPSSVGAACRCVSISVWTHAAPTELGFSIVRAPFYKHAAPNGAIELMRAFETGRLLRFGTDL